MGKGKWLLILLLWLPHRSGERLALKVEKIVTSSRRGESYIRTMLQRLPKQTNTLKRGKVSRVSGCGCEHRAPWCVLLAQGR